MPSADSRDYARRYWILGVLCVSLTLVGMAITILNVAIPDLIRELGADASDLQWIFATYGIVFAGVVVVAGAAGDRFGRKRVLDVGLVVFGVAAALGAFAPSPGLLIAARAVMGLGAALLMPGTLSIITSVFPPEERTKAIGIWSGVGGLGFIIGPPIGGILLTHFWWGSVLLVNVPVVVIALIAGARLVPDSRDPARTPLDLGGAVLSTLAISALVFAFIEAPSNGWGGPPVLAAVLVAAVGFAAFTWWELRQSHPMLDVRLFRQAAFTGPALVITFGFFVVWGVLFLLPQFLQLVQGRSALWVGLVLAVISVTWCVGATGITVVVRRVGERPVIVAGLVVTAVGVACLLGVDSAASTSWVIVGLSTIGLGMGSVTTPATSMLVSHLPPEKAGVGSAMNDVTREFGTAFGVAVLGTVVAFRYSGRLADITARLPAAKRTAARNNVSQALDVARDIGGAGGARLASATRSAFTSGFTLAVVVSIVLLVVLAAVAVAVLPHALRVRRHHWWGSPIARPPDLVGAAVPAEMQAAPVRDTGA
ncbi:MAG: MFS transporter [Actinomycetota bacterium]|nr:MFS transporter [Actinomycetota bacterium]